MFERAHHREVALVLQALSPQALARTLVRGGASTIKFEIVHEGRIELQQPGGDDNVCAAAAVTKAIAMLRGRPHRLDECMRAMQITGVSAAQLWQRIRRLEKTFA